MADLTGFFDGQGFDPETAPPDVVPPGDYTVQIDASSIKETKAKDGHYIEVEMTILDECPSKGCYLWDYLNIHNKNPKAVEMAKRSLGALSVASGIPDLKDTDMLLQKVVIACVKVKDDQNNIRTYKVAGQAQVAPTPAAPSGAAVAFASTVAPAASPAIGVEAYTPAPLPTHQQAPAAIVPATAPDAAAATAPGAPVAPWLKP